MVCSSSSSCRGTKGERNEGNPSEDDPQRGYLSSGFRLFKIRLTLVSVSSLAGNPTQKIWLIKIQNCFLIGSECPKTSRFKKAQIFYNNNNILFFFIRRCRLARLLNIKHTLRHLLTSLQDFWVVQFKHSPGIRG